jgi:hypothetical protein
MAVTEDEYFQNLTTTLGSTSETTVIPAPITNEEAVTEDQYFSSGSRAWQSREDVAEKGMEVILEGLPNNGRILQDKKTNKLYYVDALVSTGDQDYIKNIMDRLSQGEEVDTKADLYSRVNKDILSTEDESGLLAQQFRRGGVGFGSYADDIIGDNPLEEFRYEKMRKAYAEEYPERAIPMQLAGLGTSLYGGFKGVQALSKAPGISKGIDALRKWHKSNPPLGQRITEIAGTTVAGGTEGLIYGSGDGNTTEERLGNALEQGKWATIITLPIATAFPIIGAAINRFKVTKAQISAIATELGISHEAATMLKNAFDSGTSLEQMLENVARAGNQKMMADANEAMAALADASGASSAQQSGRIHKAVDDRVTQSSAQMDESFDEILGTSPEGTTSIVKDVMDSTRVARGNAYDAAYAIPVNWESRQGKNILDALKTIPKQLMDDVNALLKAEGKGHRIKYKGVDKKGNIIFDELPTTETLDILKKQLDKIVYKAKDGITGEVQGIQNQIAELTLDRLRNNLKELIPEYAAALKLGQGTIQTRQAVFLGEKILNQKVSRDEIKEWASSASDVELKAIRKGLREQIDEIMANAKTAASTGRAVEVSEAMALINNMSSAAVKTKLELVLGKKTTEALLKRLDETRVTIELKANVAKNSKTAIRLNIDKIADDLIEKQTSAVGSILWGKPGTATGKLRDFFTGNYDEFAQSNKEVMYREIGDILTTMGDNIAPRGSRHTVDTALKYFEEVKQGKHLTKPQATWLAKFIKDAFEKTTGNVATSAGIRQNIQE